ncbi:cupredoxin domain-containing protein [Ideonella sp. BN130291]|uniref:cupredoxin domain-containing protein n=1 Tax=Ideonella sp. BN130291 TaxID=3112940 RepID=UPI002E2524AC|nr:cupredoxin family copper-binding protein [Ideonella sp. BN130291]
MRALPLAIALLGLPTAAFCANHVVTIDGMSYQPAVLTVKRGDRITWQNKDVVPHTATSAGHFDSKQIARGAQWSWTAGPKGRHDVVCTFHPGMKATVVVAE